MSSNPRNFQEISAVKWRLLLETNGACKRCLARADFHSRRNVSILLRAWATGNLRCLMAAAGLARLRREREDERQDGHCCKGCRRRALLFAWRGSADSHLSKRATANRDLPLWLLDPISRNKLGIKWQECDFEARANRKSVQQGLAVSRV